jgi:uncharacterized protein YfaS (alpha-2-macroglobulin family)
MNETTTEKTVTVEHYVLPKFAVQLKTGRSYYAAGSRVDGRLDAAYFFGKPVSGGKVRIEGYTFDLERRVTFTLEGETDEAGHFDFEFNLPGYLTGTELDGGQARYTLQASVIDGAAHTQTSSLSLPVSGSSLIMEAVPEGGSLRPGMENILYVLVAYPDGSPAAADLVVTFNHTGEQVEMSAGEYGLAEVRFTPQNTIQEVTITARDRRGSQAERTFVIDNQWSNETILLRPERPIYRVGETMNLAILTAQPLGTVYVDIVREGQTISTQSAEVQDGQAALAVDLSPDMYGTLELHAYRVLAGGSIMRDSRLVVVDQAEDLRVSLSTPLKEYRPGETIGLSVQVKDGQGTGTQSAVGLAIVDESVSHWPSRTPVLPNCSFCWSRNC